MSKRNQLGAALGTAKKTREAKVAKQKPRRATAKKSPPEAKPGARKARRGRAAPKPPRTVAEDAAFIGSTTTNGEIQDLDDPRVYHRKARPGSDARSVRKMSVYMDAEVADQLDVARIKLKARDRSELVQRAVEEFLQRHLGA